ncbi:MAG: helix-turn-helix transcriptional regulator [Bacteroidales bacterium]|nr:helix-turn-helix transcriptional regulator [Bacteroidales bacterium]
MKDQIIKLMEAEGLTPAKFADEIGVQRSSISHIISGRNKPSYDFIIKIMKRFSGLNTEWLLTGRGSMIKSNENIGYRGERNSTLFDQEKIEKKTTENSIDEIKFNSEEQKKTMGKGKEKEYEVEYKNNKILEFTNVNYILVFFKDGTFKQYSARE